MATKPAEIQSVAVVDFLLLLGFAAAMQDAKESHQQAAAWERRARCIEQATAQAVIANLTNLPR